MHWKSKVALQRNGKVAIPKINMKLELDSYWQACTASCRSPSIMVFFWKNTVRETKRKKEKTVAQFLRIGFLLFKFPSPPKYHTSGRAHNFKISLFNFLQGEKVPYLVRYLCLNEPSVINQKLLQ